MIEQKQLPTAEPQLDLETIRKRYYEAQTEIAALTAMVATYDAELERVRALPSKWREDGEKEEGDGEMGAAIACWCCANELEAALASPAAEQKPAPDVEALVEALDITELRKLLLILRGNIGGAMWTLDDEEEELAVRTERAIDAIAALAAHRKQGGDV